MSKRRCEIRIGTSGWHYADWEGRFYPEKLPRSKWLEHYAKDFDTVEINNTFYQQPKEQTYQNWHKQAPKDFLYTVKANRYITHIKRMREPKEPLERFFKGVLLLKEHLGPILYQLPPGLHKDPGRLESFLKVLPTKLTAVFEFRHKSWFSEETYKLLKEFNAGFCIHDMPGMKVPRVITSDVIYVRFHGPTGRYQGNYSKPALREWAKWIGENTKGKKAVFCYFNNDYNAYAVYNAKTLKEQLGDI